MPIYTSLKNPILDITARMRGHDDTRPVRVGHDLLTKDVVVVLDEAHAEQLATMLGHLDANPDRPRDLAQLTTALTVSQDDQDTWTHALVDVLCAIKLGRSEPVAHVVDHTAVVAGAGVLR